LQRAHAALQLAVESPRPTLEKSVNPARAILNYGIAALALQQNTAGANERISRLDLTPEGRERNKSSDRKSISHLSLAHAIRLYMLFNGKSVYMPGRLTSGAETHLEEELARTLRALVDDTPKRAGYGGKFYEIPNSPQAVWPRASENIWMQRAHFNLLAWQTLKDLPAYKDVRYDNHTPAEYYERWRVFFSTYLDELAKKGLFIEVGSGYEKYTVPPLYNLYDFAADPAIRAKAAMVLDLWFASAGERSLKYVQGGGKSRAKASHRYDGRAGTWGAFYVWFGPPVSTAPHEAQRAFFEPTTSYAPSRVTAAIAADLPSWNTRGTYEYIERRIGMKSDQKGSVDLDLEKTVLHYGFVTSSYVIGAALLDPNPRLPPYFTSQMGRWQGAVFNGDPDGRIFPDVQQIMNSTGREESLDSDAFYTVQDRNVMVSQKSWRLTSSYMKNATIKTRVYVSPTLDAVQEEDCWIFAREGTAYAAVRVVTSEPSCGYTWTRPWQHEAKANPRNYNYIYLTDPEGMSPVILMVNEASDYGGDFGRFKAAVKSQPIDRAEDQVRFANLTMYLARKDKAGRFTSAARLGLRGNAPIDTSPPRVYDSPFIRSDWNSGLIHIQKGSMGEILDFRDSENPTRRVVSNVGDPTFPAGVGSAQPIVLSGR
jgi:hypothetical protein